MPYAKAEATKTLEMKGVYAVPWLKILAPIMLGAVLTAVSLRKT
jgi:hypothetical protein